MSISLVAVFIPLLLMDGLVGRLFREFAITLTTAIAISLVISLTLTPMLCAHLLKNRAAPARERKRGAGRILFRIQQWYGRSLTVVLAHSRWVLLIFTGTIALAVWLYISVPKTFSRIRIPGGCWALSALTRAFRSSRWSRKCAPLCSAFTVIKMSPVSPALPAADG